MNIIPLHKEVEISRNKIKKLQIVIPKEWWSTTYSFNYPNANESKPIYSKKRNAPLPIHPGWDIKKGDYRVRESMTDSVDSVYYRDLKIKILKHSIYPVVVLTILLVATVLSVFTKV